MKDLNRAGENIKLQIAVFEIYRTVRTLFVLGTNSWMVKKGFDSWKFLMGFYSTTHC